MAPKTGVSMADSAPTNKGKRSRCGEAARLAQIEKMRALTPLQRMALALEAGRTAKAIARMRQVRK